MRSESHLRPRPANHLPLTPLDFLERSAAVFPERTAVIWRGRSWTYRSFADIVTRFASMLIERGIKPGDVVSVMAPNRPEMLAAHYAVPMVGAVLNTINTRLEAGTVAYILEHAESRMLIADPTCLPVAKAAVKATSLAILPEDHERRESGEFDLFDESVVVKAVDHCAFVTDEWQPICLNYTSGTTGRPKGVVYHHRGAYLNALGNVLALGFDQRTSYLWTLPMFHCNGWCHVWAIVAAGGVNVCLERIDPAQIFAEIETHKITHLACAPVVLYMLMNHPDRAKKDVSRKVAVATGGASPTSALIEQMDALGFDLIHLYGLTESYGPATLRVLSDEEAVLNGPAKAQLLARQGVRHVTASSLRVIDATGEDIPRDGTTMGEIVLSGNTLMAGYYRDAAATEAAFAGELFHTGDLAVMHADGHIEIKDRSKDVIISGGENISSLEVESILYRHPAVLLAAVVAAPDPKWGEIPCAFIELKSGAQATAAELELFCRQHLAGFKIPRRFVFRELPKTATGKIQKFILRDEARAGQS